MGTEWLELVMKTSIPAQTNIYAFGTTETPALILVEPRRPKVSERAARLRGLRPSLITAHEARDIYLMAGSIQVSCALLSDELGTAALKASAEAVRWQWPKTRIVILGAPGKLGDHLFDDSVPHTSDVIAFLAANESVAEPTGRQRLNNRK